MFDIEDVDFKFTTELYRTKNGFIDPNIWTIGLEWGETSFYHENWLLSLMFDNWIKFVLIIIRDAFFFLGSEIFNGMIEPILTKIMLYY